MNGQKTERAVVSCGEQIRYTLERKNVKNINLRVHPDGEVFVSAPRSVSLRQIDDFVISRGSFIFAARRKLEAKRPPAVKRFEDGEIFPVLGQPLRLTVVRADNERAQSEGGRLFLYVRDPDDATRKQKVYNEWLLRRCEKVFGETAEQVCARLKGYGVPHATVAIRDMKTRWGTCKPSEGKITLNKQLIKADMECVEYVIVHEYAHFLYPDHSPAFHAFVASVLPDWKARKDRLRRVEIVKGQ